MTKACGSSASDTSNMHTKAWAQKCFSLLPGAAEMPGGAGDPHALHSLQSAISPASRAGMEWFHYPTFPPGFPGDGSELGSGKQVGACQWDMQLGEPPCHVTPTTQLDLWVRSAVIIPPIPTLTPTHAPCLPVTQCHPACHHCMHLSILTAKHPVTNQLRLSFQDRGNHLPLQMKVAACWKMFPAGTQPA